MASNHGAANSRRNRRCGHMASNHGAANNRHGGHTAGIHGTRSSRRNRRGRREATSDADGELAAASKVTSSGPCMARAPAAQTATGPMTECHRVEAELMTTREIEDFRGTPMRLPGRGAQLRWRDGRGDKPVQRQRGLPKRAHLATMSQATERRETMSPITRTPDLQPKQVEMQTGDICAVSGGLRTSPRDGSQLPPTRPPRKETLELERLALDEALQGSEDRRRELTQRVRRLEDNSEDGAAPTISSCLSAPRPVSGLRQGARDGCPLQVCRARPQRPDRQSERLQGGHLTAKAVVHRSRHQPTTVPR